MSNEEKAIAYFELYTRSTYDATNISHKAIVNDMAQFLANTSDNLGLASMSSNGISEANMSNFPNYIIQALASIKKRVKFL